MQPPHRWTRASATDASARIPAHWPTLPAGSRLDGCGDAPIDTRKAILCCIARVRHVLFFRPFRYCNLRGRWGLEIGMVMRWSLSFSLSLALIPCVVLAQTSVDATRDAVVVSAPRLNTDTRQLPASVTVIGREDIAASPAKTLPDLLTEQVGIGIQDYFGNNAATTTIDLRGFGATGGQNTLILVDGRRLNDIDQSAVQWASVPLSSIERIEILRGTGAVLYGDGASGGVINIVTRSPFKQGPQAELLARTGTYGTNEGQVSGRINYDRFAFNANSYGYVSNGYRSNNRNEQANANIGMRWGDDQTYLDFRAGSDKQDLRLPGARTIQASTSTNEFQSNPRGAQTPNDYASRDGGRVGLTLGARIGEAEWMMGLDYRGKDQRAFYAASGAREIALENTSITPRVRFPVQAAGFQHVLTMGVDLHDWRYRLRTADTQDNLATPSNIVTVAQHNRAFYLQDRIALGERTGLTLGLRRERVAFAATDHLDTNSGGYTGLTNLNGANPTAASDAAAVQRQQAWEMGLRHTPNATWSGFARLGRSYRLLNVDELYESNASYNQEFQILRPQVAYTGELGTEWTALNTFVRAAVFRTDIRDEIHLDPFTTGTGNTNLPPSRRQGVELESRWQAQSTLSVRGGYTYTDARFISGTLTGSADAIGTNMSIAGKHVPLVPTHKLNVGARWDANTKTRVNATLLRVASQYMDNDEPNTLGSKIPAYTKIDLKAVYSLPGARLSLNVNNLTDAKYYTYAVRSAFTSDKYAVYPLAGRTLMLGLEIDL